MLPSSCSAAVLQSGARCKGVGDGAGVGGDAGAEGGRLCGMDAAIEFGLLGVCIGRGGGRVMGPFRFDRATGDGNMEGGGGRDELSEASAKSMLLSSCGDIAPSSIFGIFNNTRRVCVRGGVEFCTLNLELARVRIRLESFQGPSEVTALGDAQRWRRKGACDVHSSRCMITFC